ncbi:OmpA family protein [Candidatus Poribacteria bacterium]|nr:OmpA family protein [Candidatus Poribacteria bacterium]
MPKLEEEKLPARKRQALPRDNDGDEGGDDWLMTYGDLMTQLVCFFVLLMSFSVISSMKFREVIVSLQDALNGNGVLNSWKSVADEIPRNMNIDAGAMMELKAQVEQRIKSLDMSEHVETEIGKAGLIITLTQRQGYVFFDTAEAVIKEAAFPILEQIALIIRKLPNDVRIEGHTDIRPISTPQFPSNWELSTMRASNVLRFLQGKSGVNPNRFSCVGYGPYRPIASNDTEENMARNRRVEIVILYAVNSDVGDEGFISNNQVDLEDEELTQ